MKMLARLGNSYLRPLALLVLGYIAGQMEYGARDFVGDGMESIYLSRMAHAAVLGIGLAALTGVPKRRMAIALTWSALAGFVSVSYYLFSPLLGRMLFGALLGFAMVAAGPIYPVPWFSMMRGALGACLGSVVAHYAAANGAPTWLWAPLGAVVLGMLLTPSKSEQLRAILAREIEAVHFGGNPEIRAQADAITHLAVKSIEEMEDRQDRTGENVHTAREEVIEITAHLLRLIHRYATLPPRAEQMRESLRMHIDQEEGRLTTCYCREVGELMRHTTNDTFDPAPPLVPDESQSGY